MGFSIFLISTLNIPAVGKSYKLWAFQIPVSSQTIYSNQVLSNVALSARLQRMVSYVKNRSFSAHLHRFALAVPFQIFSTDDSWISIPSVFFMFLVGSLMATFTHPNALQVWKRAVQEALLGLPRWSGFNSDAIIEVYQMPAEIGQGEGLKMDVMDLFFLLQMTTSDSVVRITWNNESDISLLTYEKSAEENPLHRFGMSLVVNQYDSHMVDINFGSVDANRIREWVASNWGKLPSNFSATESYFHYVLFPWLKYKGYERLQTGRIFSKESRQKLTSFGFKPATQFGESTMVFDLTSFTPPPGQGVGEFFDRLMGLYDSRAPRVVAKAA